MDNQPSEDEIRSAADVLKKLEPGFLPPPLFHEITRLTTAPIIEIVPLRRHSNVTEVLLLKRDADDPVWPDKLHTPGTVVRATDTLQVAQERILNKELSGIEVSKPKFVTNIMHHSGRGMEASQIYWVEVKGETNIGKFYDLEHLPDNLVQTQLDFITRAVADYEAQLYLHIVSRTGLDSFVTRESIF